jgi:hypothetical protein
MKQISHLHSYSDLLLSTLLKHLWQWLHPRVFGMTLQAWHICIFGVSPILLRRSSQALSGWMGSVAAHLFSSAGFKSGLWLCHSRTFRDLSRSHSCIVLALCLGLLFCWKGNVRHRLRSWVLWIRFLIKDLSVLCSGHLSLPSPDLWLDTILSRRSTIPSNSQLGFCSVMHCQLWDLI